MPVAFKYSAPVKDGNTNDDKYSKTGHVAKLVIKKYKSFRASQCIKHVQLEQDEPVQSSKRTKSEKKGH